MDQRVRCAIMRGGTSKAVVFAAQDLPNDRNETDRTILAAFGSPDLRQIDGLGGADPLTSKFAVVSPSERGDADVDYVFGQVGISTATINYNVNCGNTAAAVAVFAVQEGLVKAADSKTRVRIFSRNNDKLILAEVPTEKGVVKADGDFHISGVPRPGAEILLHFIDPSGGMTGRLLPSESAVNEIALNGGDRYRFSLIDCGNLYAIIPAKDLALDGTESPEQIESISGLMERVEELRQSICAEFLPDLEPNVPLDVRATLLKIAVVGHAPDFATSNGEIIRSDSPDVVARIINQERVHKAFAVTGAMSFAAAAIIPGTTVNVLCRTREAAHGNICIGHPQGLIDTKIEIEQESDRKVLKSVQISRTARRIMDGFVYVPTAESI